MNQYYLFEIWLNAYYHDFAFLSLINLITLQQCFVDFYENYYPRHIDPKTLSKQYYHQQLQHLINQPMQHPHFGVVYGLVCTDDHSPVVYLLSQLFFFLIVFYQLKLSTNKIQ